MKHLLHKILSLGILAVISFSTVPTVFAEQIDYQQSWTELHNRIENNVSYSDEGIFISSQILGDLKEFFEEKQASATFNMEDMQGYLLYAYLVFSLVIFVYIIISGGILLIFFKRPVTIVTEYAINNIWANLGWGVLACVLFPFIFMALIATVVGIPLAFLTLFAFGVIGILSKIFVGLIIGRKIISIDEEDNYFKVLLAFFLGTVILEIVALIPLVGWIFKFLLLAIMTGAFLCYSKDLAVRLREDNML